MSDEIKRALTAEEWASVSFSSAGRVDAVRKALHPGDLGHRNSATNRHAS